MAQTMIKPIYYIGDEYHYPNKKKRFKLIYVDDFIYQFECGHKITDTVFIDLIHVKSKLKVCEMNYDLFINN